MFILLQQDWVWYVAHQYCRLFLLNTPMQITHQIFQKYEIYYISTQFSYLLTPITVLVIYLHYTHSLTWLSLKSLLIPITVYLITLITSIMIYQLSFWHLLIYYLGPLICKISDFRLAIIFLDGYKAQFTEDLYVKYRKLSALISTDFPTIFSWN